MKAIIISVVFIVLGIGISAISDNNKTINSIGGGLFIIGLIVCSMAVWNMVKNGKK